MFMYEQGDDYVEPKGYEFIYFVVLDDEGEAITVFDLHKSDEDERVEYNCIDNLNFMILEDAVNYAKAIAQANNLEYIEFVSGYEDSE